MKKSLSIFILASCAMAVSKPKVNTQAVAALELQMACKRLQSGKELRHEWELDFKQASEKWLEVKQIERAFDGIENCQEKTDSLHQAITRIESLLAKDAAEAEKELNRFSNEGQVCKSKEKAERLRLVLNRAHTRVEEFRNTSEEASELHKKQIALAEGLESAKSLPAEIDPKVQSMKERLANAIRARKALQKSLEQVLRQEKASVGVQPCDTKNAKEWLEENEKLSSQINEMIEKAVALKPTLEATLKCKPFIDTTLLEKTKDYPKKLSASVGTRRGDFVVQRCLETAAFYDEVSQTIEQGEQAEKNWRRMKEKEADDLRRASSPTLRRQKERERQLAETVPNTGGR